MLIRFNMEGGVQLLLTHHELSVPDRDLDRARLLIRVPDVDGDRLLDQVVRTELQDEEHALLDLLAICNSLPRDPLVAHEVNIKSHLRAIFRLLAIDVNLLVTYE